ALPICWFVHGITVSLRPHHIGKVYARPVVYRRLAEAVEGGFHLRIIDLALNVLYVFPVFKALACELTPPGKDVDISPCDAISAELHTLPFFASVEADQFRDCPFDTHRTQAHISRFGVHDDARFKSRTLENRGHSCSKCDVLRRVSCQPLVIEFVLGRLAQYTFERSIAPVLIVYLANDEFDQVAVRITNDRPSVPFYPFDFFVLL